MAGACDNILQGLKFLHPDLGKDPAAVVELCATGCYGYSPYWEGPAGGKKGLIMGWFNNAKLLAKVAAELDAGWDARGDAKFPEAVYVTINPVDSALLGRAANRVKAGDTRSADKDVPMLRNLYIDIDAKRPSGVSATDAEKSAAREQMKKVKSFLQEHLYWPDPMICDSGNGAHLIFKLHAESTKENVGLVKEMLTSLGLLFDTTEIDPVSGRQVSTNVDTTCHNPARLVKLYGTAARKGDATPDRPHRVSRVVFVPSVTGIMVTVPMLQDAIEYMHGMLDSKEEGAGVTRSQAGDAPVQSRPKSAGRVDKASMFSAIDGAEPLRQGGSLRVDEYLAAYDVEVHKVKELDDGGRLYILPTCLFDPSHAGGEAAIGQQESGLLFYQCYHSSCQGKSWKDARQVISGDDSLGKFMEGGATGIVFPIISRKTGMPLKRVENFVALLNAYNIRMRENAMTRMPEFYTPDGYIKSQDKQANLVFDICSELCAKHGLNADSLRSWIRLVADAQLYHPVQNWIESKPWDGVARLEQLLATVKVSAGHEAMWRVYLHKWLLQGAGALYVPEFHARGVLTFAGEQQIGKTTWFRNLCPASLKAFGEGMTIDPSNKDHLQIALGKWLVELGEVDATFRRADISRLKAFLTKPYDEFRAPYDPFPNRWKRQTFFGATVNPQHFLVDDTGNSRWWVVTAEAFDWTHKVDIQQVWAEYRQRVLEGESWTLTADESKGMNELNQQFEDIDPMEERLRKFWRFDTLKAAWRYPMTTSSVLEVLGMTNTKKSEATSFAATLTRLCGPSKLQRIDGVVGRYYDMPPRADLNSRSEASALAHRVR